MNFGSLIAELENGANTIELLIKDVTLSQARYKPSPDTRSILEVIAHLYDEEREDFRPRLDIALNRPDVAWSPIDPDGWVIQRKYNDRDLVETWNAFKLEREESLVWLRGLKMTDWDTEHIASFGPIRAGDLLSAWVAHDLLHIRQLVELRWVRVVNLVEPYHLKYAGDW
jgi:hypothetical protein